MKKYVGDKNLWVSGFKTKQSLNYGFVDQNVDVGNILSFKKALSIASKKYPAIKYWLITEVKWDRFNKVYSAGLNSKEKIYMKKSGKFIEISE